MSCAVWPCELRCDLDLKFYIKPCETCSCFFVVVCLKRCPDHLLNAGAPARATENRFSDRLLQFENGDLDHLVVLCCMAVRIVLCCEVFQAGSCSVSAVHFSRADANAE